MSRYARKPEPRRRRVLGLLCALCVLAGCAGTNVRRGSNETAPFADALTLGALDQAAPSGLAVDSPELRACTADDAPVVTALAAQLADAPRTLATMLTVQSYWRERLLHEDELDAAAAEHGDEPLAAELAAALRQGHASAFDRASVDALQLALTQGLGDEGAHGLVVRAGPLLDVRVWQHEETRNYRVALPDGVIDVRVTLLDGFVLAGWRDFASCGRERDAAWLTPGEIYLARGAADVDSEAFRVGVLTPQAQRRLDDREHPELEAVERAYRAALAALAKVERPEVELSLLRHAERATTSAKGAAAGDAAYWLLRALCQRLFSGAVAVPVDDARWRAVTPAVMRAAATALLLESTRALDPQREGRGRRFLPDLPPTPAPASAAD